MGSLSRVEGRVHHPTEFISDPPAITSNYCHNQCVTVMPRVQSRHWSTLTDLVVGKMPKPGVYVLVGVPGFQGAQLAPTDPASRHKKCQEATHRVVLSLLRGAVCPDYHLALPKICRGVLGSTRNILSTSWASCAKNTLGPVVKNVPLLVAATNRSEANSQESLAKKSLGLRGLGLPRWLLNP